MLRAAGRRPHRDRRATCCSPPTRSPSADVRPVRRRATSGTWSTGRTGRSASRCSAACPRAPTRTAGSRRWRTTALDIRRWLLPAARTGDRRDGRDASTYVVVGLGALGQRDRVAAGRAAGDASSGSSGSSSATSAAPRHDTSRILRHSYHTPDYVRLTFEAYDDWARARGATSGEPLVTVTGGARPVPARLRHPADRLHRVDGRGRHRRSRCSTSPQIARALAAVRRCPDGTRGLYQARTGDRAGRARGTAAMQRLAPRHGAVLRDRVAGHRGRATTAPHGIEVETPAARPTACRRLVVTRRRLDQRRARATSASQRPADGHAGAGDVLPARTTRQRSPRTASRCGSGWTTRRSTASRRYGEPTVKAAQDCGGPVVDRATTASFEPDPAMRAAARRLHGARRSPAPGRPMRSKTLPVHADPRPRLRARRRCPATRRSSSGSGAAHGFKFAPTFGRLLADLAIDRHAPARRSTSTPFRLDRPALTDPDHPSLAGVSDATLSASVPARQPELALGQAAATQPAICAAGQHAAVHASPGWPGRRSAR